MASHPLHGIELFSGVGMLGEGLRAGLAHLGIPYRAVCHVEREAHAASVMVARMEEGSMDAAPVWSDVTTFDARKWRGKVDCVVAGFPCQDLSVAGRRAGLDGDRSGLFFEVVRIASDSGAWLILLENVAGIASATASVMDPAEGELDERAASRVLGELADCGWDAEWLTLSASDVGASHGRARWFCVAWRHLADSTQHVRDGAGDWQGWSRWGICQAGDAMDDAMCPKRWPFGICGACRQQGHDGERRQADCGPRIADEALGNTSGDGRGEGRPELSRRPGRSDPCGVGMSVADTGRTGRQGDELSSARARDGARQEAHGPAGQLCGLFAPGPADPRWAAILQHHPELAPALEPAFRSLVNGLAFDMGDSRAARLKCVGNGVVALQAAAAFVVLARRAWLA